MLIIAPMQFSSVCIKAQKNEEKQYTFTFSGYISQVTGLRCWYKPKGGADLITKLTNCFNNSRTVSSLCTVCKLVMLMLTPKVKAKEKIEWI